MALLGLLLVCPGLLRAEAGRPAHAGSAACISCHAEEGRRWQASHHALAMQVASPQRVLGDFAGVDFVDGPRRVRFFRRGDGFFIRTEGPDGRPGDFRVSHTIGVYPLQQYLLPLPGGRLQAFDVAWDARPREEGGQRWFALAAHAGARPGEALHWTGRELEWNFMCAACHTTGRVQAADPASGRPAGHQAEIGVGCEACHGAGADHARAPRAGAGLPVLTARLRRQVFAFDGTAPIARLRGEAGAGQRTTEVCAPCHARRQQLVAAPRPEAPFLDGYTPALVEPGLYFSDGQIDDEVFEYGSFAQSAMHRAGVSCTHCHDPHDGRPRAPGNALCAQCHLPARYDVAAHHGHRAGSPGAACTACHMPTRTYMGVHVRHDHRFSVPRPAQSGRLGTPDACRACHTDKGPAWAAAALARRGRGEGREPPLAGALAAQWRGGWLGPLSLGQALELSYPGIQRASLLAGLTAGRPLPPPDVLNQAAADGDGLLRLGLARALVALPPPQALAIGTPLLDDPLRAVRIEAARSLAGRSSDPLPQPLRARLEAGMAEALQAEGVAADRPEAHVNRARLLQARGDGAAAGQALTMALRLDPAFVPALINLADLHRAAGRDGEAEGLLLRAVAAAPRSAEACHALGLLRVRQGRRAEALPLLQEAASLAPDEGRYALVVAVALMEAGRLDTAAGVLENSRQRRPDDPSLLRLLAQVESRRGRSAEAAALSEALARLTRQP